jgi:hypothetical protein
MTIYRYMARAKLPAATNENSVGIQDVPKWTRHTVMPSHVGGLKHRCSPSPLTDNDTRNETCLDHASSRATKVIYMSVSNRPRHSRHAKQRSKPISYSTITYLKCSLVSSP